MCLQLSTSPIQYLDHPGSWLPLWSFNNDSESIRLELLSQQRWLLSLPLTQPFTMHSLTTSSLPSPSLSPWPLWEGMEAAWVSNAASISYGLESMFNPPQTPSIDTLDGLVVEQTLERVGVAKQRDYVCTNLLAKISTQYLPALLYVPPSACSWIIQHYFVSFSVHLDMRPKLLHLIYQSTLWSFIIITVVEAWQW